MRRWVLGAGATALIGLPTVLAFFSGGFFDEPRLVAAVTVWLLVPLAVTLAPEPLPASAPGRWALLGLFLLTVWSAVSFAWAPIGGRALDDVQRLVLYLGFMIAAVAMLRGPAVRRLLEPALALGAFVVVAYGLSERVLPQAIDLAGSGTAAGRLEQPLTYWNAMGIVAAVGTILALHIAGTPSRERPLRAAAAFAAVPMALGVYLSYARGALAALGVGVLVLLALAPSVRPQLRAIVTVGVGSALAVLLANGLPTVKSLSTRDSGDGLLMLAALLVLAAAAAAIAPRRPRRHLPVPALPVSRPATVLGITALLLVLGGLVIAALEGKPEGTSPVPGANPARLGSIDTNRYLYWEEAGATFAEHPLVGTGTGGFVVEWLKRSNRADAAGDAHSLYLETAAELGVVGVACLLMFLAGVAIAAARLYRIDGVAGTGLAAGLSAWAFHAGLDWDWEMPAVTLMALAMAAAAIAWSERGEAAGRAATSAHARQPAPVA